MRSRRLVGAVLAVGLGAIIVSAAWWLNRPESPPSSVPAAGAFLATVNAGDRSDFDALWDLDADPQRVELLWANLGQVELVTAGPGPGDSWRIGWRVPGELGVASDVAAPRWRCRPTGCLLVDLGQQPGAPAPIWLTGPVSVHQAGPVAVIGGPGAQSWSTWAMLGAEQIAGATPAELLRPAPLQVIEVPPDRRAFEQAMAAPAIDFHGIGAITWVADGGQAESPAEVATVRIVINPDATAGVGDQSRFLLLLHEQVHAATAWLGPPAAGGRWVSEGVAEWLMLQHSDDEQRRSSALLISSCPLSAHPPADEDFADPTTQPLAYAWSAAAIGQIVEADPDPQHTITRLWQGAGAQDRVSRLDELCR